VSNFTDGILKIFAYQKPDGEIGGRHEQESERSIRLGEGNASRHGTGRLFVDRACGGGYDAHLYPGEHLRP
jgi:hypothetical protein